SGEASRRDSGRRASVFIFRSIWKYEIDVKVPGARLGYDARVMPSRQLGVAGVRAPTFLYGTAWKEDATERLTRLALEAGFRGIDTANPRRHYPEAAGGGGMAGGLLPPPPPGGAFRAIDTATQRRHYHEAAVGAGIAGAIAAGL